MKDRRSKLFFLRTPFILHFVSIGLAYVCALVLINLYSSWMIGMALQNCSRGSSSWWVDSLISQLSFTGAIIVLLITLAVLLHRTLGPIPRLEKTLDKVIQGDYSLRLGIRKKDIIHSFVQKVNALIEALEKKSKS